MSKTKRYITRITKEAQKLAGSIDTKYPVSVGVATNTPVATIGGAVATRESIEKSATRQCPFMAAFNDTRPGAQQG
jgi:hypothetical protein